MSITPLPSPPSTSDPANFSTMADAFLAALAQFVTEANALGVANTNYFRLVDAVATSNKTLSSALANGQTLDGVTLTTGMRVLLTAQSTAAENGIYDVPASGTASRSADSNTSGFMPPGMMIVAQRGTSLQSSIWLHTTAAGLILGSTALTFAPRSAIATRQVLTSGTGATYTTSSGVRQLRIRMAAGGGGGGDNSATGGNGNAGTNSSFNSVTAVAGSGGQSAGNGGAGGSGGTGSPTGILRAAGALGAGGIPITVSTGGNGGMGGVSGFAGGYGSGGAGAGGSSFAGTLGGGGGGGEYVEFIINSPAASYTYTVGTGGARGNVNATAGSAGVIIVEEIC